MTFTTGLGATLALAQEATYGTFKTPNRFFEFEGAPFKSQLNYINKPQIGNSVLFLRGSRYLPTTKGATGTTTLQYSTVGFACLFNLLHSMTATFTKQAATSVYLQKHEVGLTEPNRSATIQLGVPNSSTGAIEAFSYLGCVVTQFDLSIGVNGVVECSFGWNGRLETREEAYKEVTVPSGVESFTFQQAELKIGGSLAEFTKDVKLTFTVPREERWYLGSSGLKAKPTQNGFGDLMVNLGQDYGANGVFDKALKGERASVELILKGVILESTFHKELTLKMPEVGFDEASPQVTGPTVVTQAPKLKALYNGSEAPLTIEALSLDKEV